MSTPDPPQSARTAPTVVSRPAPLARAAKHTPDQPHPAEPDIEHEIHHSRSGGAPLPPAMREFMAPRFHADLSGVRIHTTPHAARLAARLNARAFTVGRDIFFGHGQFRPDSEDGRELIAHELTHTIQQGFAARTDPPVSTAAAAKITQAATPHIQRWSLPDLPNPMAYLAEQANNLPGFRMLSIVIGINPLTLDPVPLTPANVLRAVVELMVGGGLIVTALDKYGIIDKAADFVTKQVAGLGLSGALLLASLHQFVASLHATDLTSPGDVWERAKQIFTKPIDQITKLAVGLVDGVTDFVKQAVLTPLADLASKTRAWDLLIAILGTNPITGEKVPGGPEAIIAGLFKLANEEEVWQNIQQSGAMAKLTAWFGGAKAGLIAFVQRIPEMFKAALKSFQIADLLNLPGTIARVAGMFGDFAGQFASWVGGKLLDVLKIVVGAVSPKALVYLLKTGNALLGILKNPRPFVGNLVAAAKLGFHNFAGNIGVHLKTGLVEWLTGALEGVYLPQALSLVEIGKFALSILDVTWLQIRGKIVKALGPTGETIMKGLETTFDVVKSLATGGVAAAWELIKEKLTDLKDTVVEGIKGFIADTIVKVAVPKVISMFIPGAGFVSAIMSIYGTIQVMMDKLAKFIQVATAFIDGIVAIAAGSIAPAAQKVEGTMAGLIPLAISVLAGFLNVGNIPAKIKGVIDKVRATVDKALDKLADWIVEKAKKFGTLVAQVGVPNDPNERLRLASRASLALIPALPRSDLTVPLIVRAHEAIKVRYGLTELAVAQQADGWHIHARINPALTWRAPLAGETAGTGGIYQVATATGPGGIQYAGVVGELLPGLKRENNSQGGGAAKPNAAPIAPNYNKKMAENAGLSHMVERYQWAHLYGPGFGDEARTGLMLAHHSVNQELQSNGSHYGIEGYARRARALVNLLGGRIYVLVVGESFPDPPPGVRRPIGQPVLKSVTYTFVITNESGRKLHFGKKDPTAIITCAPPLPRGTGGQGKPKVAEMMALEDYLSGRSTRTGLGDGPKASWALELPTKLA